MAVVKKAQSISNVARKPQARTVKTQSARQPSIISEMGDVNFGDLGAANNNVEVGSPYYKSTGLVYVRLT